MSFINGGFLGALALVAVPIIIFLLFRRKFKRVEWAAMEYLLRAHKRTNRRLKIENLILLLIRCLIVTLLVMMLARPKVDAGQLLPTKQNHFVLVMDNSYSSGYVTQNNNQTILDMIKKEAVGVTKLMAPDDQISVILMNSNAKSEKNLGPISGIDEQTLDYINNVEVSHSGGNFGKALAEVRRVLDASIKPNHWVYILSDCQKAAFLSENKNAPAALEAPAEGGDTAAGTKDIDAETELKELSKRDGVKITIVDLGAEKPANVAITTLSSREQLIVRGIPVEFTAEVTNFSSQALANVDVAFKVDGDEKDLKNIESIAPHDTATVSFELKDGFKDVGYHYITAAISQDNLAIDDTRHYCVEVHPNIRVLLVNGSPGMGFQNETEYLKFALNPYIDDADLAGEIPGTFLPEVVIDTEFAEPSSAKGYANLQSFDIVCMCNVAGLQDTAVNALKTFVESGRSVVFFMGDKVRPDLYNAKLYNDAKGIMPCRLKGPSGYPDHSERLYLDPTPLQLEHPIFRLFLDTDFVGHFYDTFIFEYMDLENVDTTPDTNVLISMHDPKADAHIPAILERRLGKGKCLLVNTSADDQWTTLPHDSRSGLYLTVLYELMYYLAYRERTDLNLDVGAKLYKKYSQDYAQKGTMIMSFAASGGETEMDATPLVDERMNQLEHDKTFYAGIYTFQAARVAPARENAPEYEKRDLKIHFAVNVNAAVEGNLSRISQNEFETRYHAGNITWRRYDPSGQTVLTLDDAERKSELWKYFAYAILGFLVLESLLAQRFGNFKR